jgi:hypothetical protein
LQKDERDKNRFQTQKLMAKFFRSPLAIGIVCSNALLAVGAALAGVVSVLTVVPLFVLVTGTELTLVLLSKSGARAILREQNREREEHDAACLEETARQRKRLVALRIENPEVKAAVERLALVAGLYLDFCTKGGARDPVVEDAVQRAAEAVDGYLHLDDAARVGVRIGEKPEKTSQDLEQNTVLSLDTSTRLISEKLALSFGGIEGNHTLLDSMEGRQELRE